MLLRLLLENRQVPLSRLPVLLLFLTKTGLSVPGRIMERVFLRSRILATDMTDDPVFILGHYRSGTTWVHKLMTADARFASVSTYDLLFPHSPLALQNLTRPILQRIINLLGIKQGFFHNYVLRLDDPNELEPLMLSCGSSMSTYWGYFFPRNASRYLDRYVDFHDVQLRREWMAAYEYFLRRTTWKARGRRIVAKDPPNMGRIGPLLELYPRAKFVCIHRRPIEVFLSMRVLWRQTIERRIALQTIGPEERDAIILAHYRTLMEVYQRDRDIIPKGALVEMRYEDFLSDPVGQLRMVYTALGLPSFDESAAAITARLEEDRGYVGADYPAEPDLPPAVRAELESWNDRLGYPPRQEVTVSSTLSQ